MLGGLLALLSAAFFGFNNASVRRGVLNASVLQGMSITVPMGVPLFFLAVLIGGHPSTLTAFSATQIGLLTAAGVVHFVWGRYWNYRATKAMGGSLSAPLQQMNLVIALVLAVGFLGESLTSLKVLGIALVALGVALTLSAGRRARELHSRGTAETADADSFRPNHRAGFLFALLSSLGYGVSPILIRMGLEGSGLATSLAGGLVSYVAAAAVVGAVLLVPGRWSHIRSAERTSVKWFTLSGFLVFLSQMLRYIALSLAPVTVVAPIQSTSAVFRVVFAWLINPRHEVFGPRVIAGLLISTLGALALSASADL